ncbi:hypothetical protein ANO14919_090170 [Xylariales sp. No.14919]|nr:hypothetical protein ANO14919_090170 [Xylariales sp. No.14919]
MDPRFHQQLEAAVAQGGTAWLKIIRLPNDIVDADRGTDGKPIKKISPDEASKLARERSQSVLQSFVVLNDIIGRYEVAIRKRWAKKNTRQREQLLLCAWPGMATTSRPDLKAFQRGLPSQPRDVYMWPSINLEDLSSGNTLLRLLNTRGRHWPATFATIDGDSMRLGDRSGALPIEKVYRHEMILKGNTPETYGVIKPIQYQSVSDMMGNVRLGAAKGLRILEIQERILQFLRSICAIILHDKNLDNPLDPVVPEPEALPVPTGEWLSSASAAQAAPYEVPKNIDLNRIKSITASRIAEAQDHLWSLREDPSYFSDYIRNRSEHSYDMIFDTTRKHQPKVSDVLKEPPFWDRVVNHAVYEAYEDIFHWRLFDQQLDNIIQLQRPPRGVRQIEKCHETVRKLKMILELTYIPILVHKFETFFAASPPVRDLFQRQPNHQDPSDVSISPRRDLDMKDDLLWVWATVCEKGTYEICGLELLAVEVDRLIRDKTQKGRITAMVAQVFSDIGLAGALQNQLRIKFPQIFDKGEYHDWVDENLFRDWANEVVHPI